jgi:hypothetical protein
MLLTALSLSGVSGDATEEPVYVVIMTHIEGDKPEPEGSPTCASDLRYQTEPLPPQGVPPRGNSFAIDVAGTELLHEILHKYADSEGQKPKLFIEPAGEFWQTEADPHFGNKLFRTHVHFHGPSQRTRDCFSSAVVNSALANMDANGILRSLIMPPPAPLGGRDEYSSLANIVKTQPRRFAFMAGGESLNAMIHIAIKNGQISTDFQRRFEEKATEIIKAGAVGFGETAALHPSLNPTHPFEEAPPDHLLFLLLADLAARFDVPIDLHMEAITQDTPTPGWLRQASPNNPAILKENITGFERLLVHNRKARIVWAHAGRDPIGQTTVSLLRRLLPAHSNLYLQIALVPLGGPQRIFNRPVDANGKILPDWLDLIRSFPDRFVMGSDAFYCEGEFRQTDSYRSFLKQLPSDIASKVGLENAIRIYKLNDVVTGEK